MARAAKAAAPADSAAPAAPAASAPLLSADIKQSTSKAHRISDALVGAKLGIALTDRRLYGLAISNFYAIYASVEEKIASHADLEQLKPLAAFNKRIARKPQLEKDLEFFLGSDWRKAMAGAQTRAVRDYLQHLDVVEKKDPLLLVPYGYMLYIPILIGALKTRVKDTLKVGDDACHFLDVPAGETRSALLKELRASIDGVAWPETTRKAMLAEAAVVFRLNNNVVLSFQPSVGQTLYAFWVYSVEYPYVWGVLVLFILAAVAGDIHHMGKHQWGWWNRRCGGAVCES